MRDFISVFGEKADARKETTKTTTKRERVLPKKREKVTPLYVECSASAYCRHQCQPNAVHASHENEM